MNNRTAAAAERFETSCRKEPKLLSSGSFVAPPLLTTRLIAAAVALPTAVEENGGAINEAAAAAETLLIGETSAFADAPSAPAVGLPAAPGDDAPPRGQLITSGECALCGTKNYVRSRETLCPPCRLTGRFNALVEEQKLSLEAWERIRRTLCFPKRIEDLPPNRSRMVYQLLNSFVGRFSPDEQHAMTDETVKLVIKDLPGLPKAFVKSLMKTTKEQKTSADQKKPDGGKTKRKAISAAKFTEIAARQGLFCYCCGIKVVRQAEIPAENRLGRGAWTLIYRTNGGELREEACGTIDHLVRVADGGDNAADNLVISCYPCNRERDVKMTGQRRPFVRQATVCENCGERFFHPDWGCCTICGASSARTRKEIKPEKPEKSKWRKRLGRLLKMIGRLTGRWLE